MKKRWKHKILACMLSFAMAGTLLPYHLPGIEGMKKAEAASVEIKDTAEIYETVTKQHVTVHDPSIVVGYEDKDGKVYPDMAEGRTKVYYIFGSHMAWAYSYDLENWKTFTNNINKDYAKIFEKGAEWSAQGNAGYDVSGNLWAPDVIWSPDYINKDGSRGAWLMYMSVNGANWNSSIALLTSDSLNGDWTYADTVIYSGFTAAGNNLYTETDYQEVTGETELGSRYQTNAAVWNMRYGAHAIDACVFYDEAGKMWMSYGSWSGGIYILELDETTGLRDKKITYANTDISDPYMGTKLGGSTASGEASYIEHIGKYYYMFLSYGGLVANGGYNMRVFRSENPDGPYTDFTGHEALNGGGTNGNIGTRLMSYYKWSWWDYAQVAQGHNSAFVDTDGNAYVIYHTRTNDGTEGHSVRVHPLFTTQNGYLAAAPFEYSSTDQVKESYAKDEVAGDYEILFQYNTNNEKLEYNADRHMVLNADGTVAGDVTGSWSLVDGKPYISFTVDKITYEGILVEQMMENTNIKTLCFTAVGTNNICFWGAKYPSDAQAVSLAADSLALPEYASDDIVLPAEGILGTAITWESDSTSILSDGTVIPPAVDRNAALTATITRGDYTYKKKINITILAEVDEESGPIKIASYYTDAPINLADGTQASFGNPFKGRDISNGVFLRFKTKRNSGDLFLGNIFSFGTGNSQGADSNGRLYFTGGSYLGYNAAGGFFDANVNNTAWTAGNDYIGNDKEVQFEIQLKPSGFSVWVDGEEAYNQDDLKAGTILGSSNVQDYSNVLSWLSETADYLNFGFGSWWKDIYNGAVWDFEAWAEPVVKGSIAANEYYHEDYEGSTNLTGLWSGNATVSKETADGNKYVKIAPNGSGNRGSKCTFNLTRQPEGEFYFDTDAILKSSTGNNGSTKVVNEFQLTCEKGYILKLYAEGLNNQTFIINDQAEDTVAVPASSWIHIHVGMDTADLTKATVTITNKETSEKLLDQKEIAVKGEGMVSGISLTVGRGTAQACLDNTILSKLGMADYTEFQEALKKAQKHLRLDIYTEESEKALRAAVDAANDLPKDLMDSQQEMVDAVTVKLTEALSSLTCKEHAYNEGTIKKEATCASKGLKEVICYQCGEKKEIEIPMLAHSWGEWVVVLEATAEAAGQEKRTCTVCGEEETREIPKKGGGTTGGDSSSGGGTIGGNSGSGSGTTGGNSGPGGGITGGSDTGANDSGEKEDTNTDTAKPSDENTDQNVTTEIKEDGTKVETVKETGPDGTVKETVTETKTDGIVSVTVTETKKDGSSSETKETKAADESAVLVTTVETTADGKVNADAVIRTGVSDAAGKVEITQKLLENAADDGRISSVAIEITDTTVTTAEKSGKNTVVKVEVPSMEGVEVEKVVLTKESITAAKEAGKGLEVNVIDGAADYTVVIPAKQLEKIGSKTEEINITITAEKVTNVKDTSKKDKIEVLVGKSKGKKAKTCVVEVAENADLTAGMKVTVPVAEKTSITGNSGVYVYKYDAKTGKLYETGNCRQKVDSDGNITIAAAAGTDYVVSAKKLSGNNVETIEDNISVSLAKKNAKIGKKVAVKVSLPDSVSTKAKFGTEKAKITYKSDNSKVASVSADGVITTKKAGTAVITVTVKLAGGQKIVEKQKIKVK